MTKLSKRPGDQLFLLHPDKKGTMQLPVAIDKTHMDRLNAKMADISSERLAQEAKKRDATAPINKRLAELRQQEKEIDAERRSGQTMAEVPVEEVASFEEGVAWMIRKDTGLEVPDTRRQLTAAEKNAVRPGRGDGDAEQVYPKRVEAEDADGEDGDEEGEAEPGGDVVPFGQTDVEVPPEPELPGAGTVNVEGVAESTDTRVQLHRSDGMPGWGYYVHQGYLYFRAPNVDSFEPAGRAGDYGPFGWKAQDNQVDAMPEATNVDDAWMKAHDKLLEDADRAISHGRVKETVKPYRDAAVSVDAPPADGTPATGPDLDEGANPTGTEDEGEGNETGVQSLGAAVSALDLWKKLSDSARKVMRFLATVPAADSVVIGSKTSTRAGAVVPPLIDKGYVEYAAEPKTPAHYALTPQGRELLAAADAAKSGAKKSPPPAPSATPPEGDVPY